jgi:hypothetical protein
MFFPFSFPISFLILLFSFHIFPTPLLSSFDFSTKCLLYMSIIFWLLGYQHWMCSITTTRPLLCSRNNAPSLCILIWRAGPPGSQSGLSCRTSAWNITTFNNKPELAHDLTKTTLLNWQLFLLLHQWLQK